MCTKVQFRHFFPRRIFGEEVDIVPALKGPSTLKPKDGERRPECKKVQCRHFIVELFRQETDIVLVGLKPGRLHREQRGRRKGLFDTRLGINHLSWHCGCKGCPHHNRRRTTPVSCSHPRLQSQGITAVSVRRTKLPLRQQLVREGTRLVTKLKETERERRREREKKRETEIERDKERERERARERKREKENKREGEKERERRRECPQSTLVCGLLSLFC